MSRMRSQAIVKKKNSLTDTHISEEIKIDPIPEILHENKGGANKTLLARHSLKNYDGSSLNLKKPVYNDCKKEYASKTTKPLCFHERAQIIGNFDRKQVGEIEENAVIIDFDLFLHQYKSEEEIRNLELQDLLDLDYEKLEELKYKATEFIDATSMLIDEKDKMNENIDCEADLLLFFSMKLQEMLGNEINLHIFINNIDRVKGLAYSNNGVKIFFKNK